MYILTHAPYQSRKDLHRYLREETLLVYDHYNKPNIMEKENPNAHKYVHILILY